MAGIIVLGAGTFAMDVSDIIADNGDTVPFYVIDQGEWEPGERFLGIPVYDTRSPIWPDEGIKDFPCVAAIIRPQRMVLILGMLARGYNFINVVAKSADCSTRTRYGHGIVVHRQVAISSHGHIMDHVIINRGALIGHHVVIEPFVTIGPGANLCGRVVVQSGAVVGAGATVLENRIIGEGARVGAGALVTRDVSPRTTVMGIPARPRLPENVRAEDW